MWKSVPGGGTSQLAVLYSLLKDSVTFPELFCTVLFTALFCNLHGTVLYCLINGTVLFTNLFRTPNYDVQVSKVCILSSTVTHDTVKGTKYCILKWNVYAYCSAELIAVQSRPVHCTAVVCG